MAFNSIDSQTTVYNNQKERSLRYINRLRALIKSDRFKDVFEFIGNDDTPILQIKYLGRRFDIKCEIPSFSDEGFSQLNISTYMDLEEKLKDFVFVFAFNVDQDGIIERRFNEEDFAIHYLNAFAIKIRAKVLELNKSLTIQ